MRNCEVPRHVAGAENHHSQIIVASSFIRRQDATCEEELSQFIVLAGDGGDDETWVEKQSSLLHRVDNREPMEDPSFHLAYAMILARYLNSQGCE
jgi:hypothetical protein